MLCPTTIRRYVSVVDEFATFLCGPREGGSVPLEATEAVHVKEFLRCCARRNTLSKSLWNVRLAALRTFYGFLFKQEIITVNPAEKVDRAKIHPREPVPLSFEEVLRLADAAKQSSSAYAARNETIVHVLFHCGLRVSELVSLDVDQVQTNKDDYLFVNVRRKGNKWLSTSFNEVVAEALGRYLKDRKRMNPPENVTALFLSDRCVRMSVRAVQEMIRCCAKRADIGGRPITPHLLRHSSATELKNMGVHARVVQDHLGHARITTTQRYMHVSNGERRQVINDLGKRYQERLASRPGHHPRQPIKRKTSG